MDIHERPDNREKLMLAAIDLIAEKGYKGVSTKEIAAAAGVSEMTLFRNFGTKLNLLDQAVERYHYSAEMEKGFAASIVWDLGADLLTISRMYHETMERNRKLFLIVLKDDDLLEIRERAQKHPRKLLELLTHYFAEMSRRGKIVETDAELQAITFMWMNYGAFMSNLLSPAGVTKVSLDAFMESSVQLFVKALQCGEQGRMLP